MVETFDNALIIVPNSEFVASRLINWTRNSRTVRREIKIGVAYGQPGRRGYENSAGHSQQPQQRA